MGIVDEMSLFWSSGQTMFGRKLLVSLSVGKKVCTLRLLLSKVPLKKGDFDFDPLSLMSSDPFTLTVTKLVLRSDSQEYEC